MTKAVTDWVAKEGDFLVGENPRWFQALILSELVFQVPMCVWLARKWGKASEAARIPGIVYSAHVLTTMVPIFGSLVLDPRPSLTCKAVYAVWIFFPLLLAMRCISDPMFSTHKRLSGVASPQFSSPRKKVA